MEKRQENKMGVMPVNRLLVSMSLPIMVSMLMQALYNVVDSIFVARYSANALAAVSLAFPVQSLMISFAVGTGVGINSLLSRRLGEKRFEEANACAVNGIFLAGCTWVGFALLGGLFSRAFMQAFTQDPEIVTMGTQYLMICTLLSLGVFMQLAAERIMQATGQTVYHMVIQGVGALINIVLDPILIFGLFGLPAMGVAGAAVATVAGQLIAMALGLYLCAVKNREVSISFKGFRPDGAIIREIYRVGAPSIVMQSILSVLTVGLNKILILYSAAAVSVLGIYFKLQSFVFMPVFGLTNGMIPIVAYNFGARNRARIERTVRFASQLSLAIMLAGTLLFELLPEPLLRMFNATPEMLTIGVPALRIISLSFCFAGVGIVLSSVFQAIGNGLLSLVASVARQLVIILPASYLLARFFGLDANWWSFPIAEVASLILCLWMYRSVYKRQIQPL